MLISDEEYTKLLTNDKIKGKHLLRLLLWELRKKKYIIVDTKEKISILSDGNISLHKVDWDDVFSDLIQTLYEFE